MLRLLHRRMLIEVNTSRTGDVRTSARLSSKWYELDIGWGYIRVLQALGLAQVKHLAPVPVFSKPKPMVDAASLSAVITCRYDVMAKYARSLETIYRA